MNNSKHYIDCADEFDIDRIYLKLTSSCTSYTVPANMFFVQPSGVYAEMQALYNAPRQQQKIEQKAEC